MGSSCSRDSVTKPTNDFHIDEIDAVKRKEEDREKAEYEAMIAEEAKKEKEASGSLPPPEAASPVEKKYAYGWGSESDPKRVIRRDSAPMTQQVGMVVEQLDDDEEVDTQEEIEARKKRADNITDLFASYKQKKTPVTRSTHVPVTKTMAIEPLPMAEKDQSKESSLAFMNFRTPSSALTPSTPLDKTTSLQLTPSSPDPPISPSHAFARRSSLSSTPSGARQLPALNHTTQKSTLNTTSSTATSTEAVPSHKPTPTTTSAALSISAATSTVTSTSSSASSATSSLPDSLSAFTMAASSATTSSQRPSISSSSPIPARKSISSTTSTNAKTSPPRSTSPLAHSPLAVQRKASLTSLHHPRATTMAASSILSSSSSSINHSTSTSTSTSSMNHSTPTSSLRRPSGFARMGAASLGTVS